MYKIKTKDDNAELYIYGDIESETNVSANDIINQLQNLHASKIDVYINSYGGEVAQGLAIYNALKRHSAKVTTYVDGFACSIASVIAMAGDVRKMYNNSLLMIHNAWTYACGNADELLKQAEDLKTINEATKKAYLEVVNISEDELTALLDAETWLTAEKAVEMGFATEIVNAKKSDKASASAQDFIFKMLTDVEVDPEEPNDPDDNKLEELLTDIVSRLEKLESEVFPKDEPEDNPEEKQENNATLPLQKFLNALKK